MSNYCILTIEKIKSYGSLQRRMKHNRREMNLANVDMEQSIHNEELVPGYGFSYLELWKKRMTEAEIETNRKIKPRKNSVLAAELVLSYSADAKIDVEEWKTANLRWLQQTFGKKNVITATLHKDERTPHIHSIIVPIDDRGHLCAKSFFGGREKMFGLQDSYARSMAPFGLERGERYTRAKKQDLDRFYASVEKAANMKVPERLPDEPTEEYMNRINDFVQTTELRCLKLVQDAERERDVALSRLLQYKKDYSEGIHLQKEIEETEGTENGKNIIHTLRVLKKAIPRKQMKEIMTELVNRFKPDFQAFDRWFREKRKEEYEEKLRKAEKEHTDT